MTAIFGVVNLDQRPADYEALHKMAHALRGWPLEPPRMLVSGPVALGTCLLRVTEADKYDTQPLSEGALQLAGHIRLDNRDELQRSLNLPHPEIQSDSAYVIAAYRHWGPGFQDRLLGDWCFALWDGTCQTLLLARDTGGNTSMYWWTDGKTIVFANALKAVLAHPSVPRTVNELMVACYLTNFQDPEVLGATMYAGIHRLRPGYCLKASVGGINPEKWWYPEALYELRLKSTNEYYEAFRELYRDAVVSRLRVADGANVGLALSSGLDSGSIMALAAPHLAREGKRLQGYVHRPMDGIGDFGPYRNPDEHSRACAAAAFVGNTNVLGLRHESASWVAGIQRGIEIHGQPNPGSSSHYWIHDLLAQAGNNGIRVLLTGQGGNGTVSWTGTGNVWPALRRGHWIQTFRDLIMSRLPRGKALRLQLLSPAKQAWRRFSLARQTNTPIPLHQISAINPAFSREMHLEERMRSVHHDFLNRPPYASHQLRTFRLEGFGGGMAGDVWLDMENTSGIAVRDPTRDRRLIELCWQIPDRIFWDGGRERALIRRGFEGLLPPETLQDTPFGVQMADVPLRFRKERAAVAEVLAEGLTRGEVHRWFDLKLLQASLDPARYASNIEAYDVISGPAARNIALLAFANKNACAKQKLP